jgi:hypothetical protein
MATRKADPKKEKTQFFTLDDAEKKVHTIYNQLYTDHRYCECHSLTYGDLLREDEINERNLSKPQLQQRLELMAAQKMAQDNGFEGNLEKIVSHFIWTARQDVIPYRKRIDALPDIYRERIFNDKFGSLKKAFYFIPVVKKKVEKEVEVYLSQEKWHIMESYQGHLRNLYNKCIIDVRTEWKKWKGNH